MVAKKKQTEMGGTQADRIPVIENAICEWREAIDERMQLGEREVKKRDIVDELMKKHGCYLVPTRMAGEAVLEAALADALPEWAKKKTYEVVPRMRSSFERAVRQGVLIAFGTDAGVFPHGLNGRVMILVDAYGSVAFLHFLPL